MNRFFKFFHLFLHQVYINQQASSFEQLLFMGSYCLMDMEFQFGKKRKFWKWMVVMAAKQCEYTLFH